MKEKCEIYVSTDIEADGPIPGQNSMLSFGSAVYLEDKTLVSTFSANLETLSGANPDPRTMEWWGKQPKAWKACRENLLSPQKAMFDYLAWIKNMPKHWFDNIPHTHTALDDAIEQGALFCNMLKELKGNI